MRNLFILLIFANIFLTGCAVKQPSSLPDEQIVLDKKQRALFLKDLNQWLIKGKIAFITSKERQSASLRWQFDATKQSQQLNLTAYLGINFLSLSSQANQHTVIVEGNEYKSENLDELITSLTGFTIPTYAMHSWLKGLAYDETDEIKYHPITQLPQQLTSLYNGSTWQIHYQSYQQVGKVQLVKKLTIKQNDLTIKLVINRWQL